MDQIIKCKDCGKDFVFSEEEQKFFQKLVEDGKIQTFVPPKRCKSCRQVNKKLKQSRNYQS